jgi:hypothetical protein
MNGIQKGPARGIFKSLGFALFGEPVGPLGVVAAHVRVMVHAHPCLDGEHVNAGELLLLSQGGHGASALWAECHAVVRHMATVRAWVKGNDIAASLPCPAFWDGFVIR